MYKHPLKGYVIEALKKQGIKRPSPAREDKTRTSFHLNNLEGSTAVLRLYDLQETSDHASQWFWFEFGVGTLPNDKADVTIARVCEMLYEFPYSFRPAIVPYEDQSLLVLLIRGTAQSMPTLEHVSDSIEIGLLIADDLRKRLNLKSTVAKAS